MRSGCPTRGRLELDLEPAGLARIESLIAAMTSCKPTAAEHGHRGVGMDVGEIGSEPSVGKMSEMRIA